MSLSLLLALAIAHPAPDALRFDQTRFTERSSMVDGVPIRYRAYEGILTVEMPVDPKYQSMNVYVPVEYVEGKSRNGYRASTAPIFLPNTVGGYMPGAPAIPGAGMDARNNTIHKALLRGYVVACPGARGRTLKDVSGRFVGKAPAGIVDLKAAVRYLKANDDLMPGNARRIVSNGTSAGGAMSALLGATGDAPDYEPYLSQLRAAKASDSVWAVSAYCPITNLENADMAYEWLLSEVTESKRFGPMGGPPGRPGLGQEGAPPPNPFGQPDSKQESMSPVQIAHAAMLKAMFPRYVNGLQLRDRAGIPLELGQNGEGSFKEALKDLLIASANTAIRDGKSVADTPWVTVRDGRAANVDWEGFVRLVGRMKQTSAFDSPRLTSGENNLFGSSTVDSRHFTDFGMSRSAVEKPLRAEAEVVRMMNPMYYLESGGARVARYWRIRHGAIDRDTSIAIPAILGWKLANLGADIDLAFPWNTPHSGDYDLNELFDWIDARAR